MSSALRLPAAEASLATADEDAAERAYLRRLVVFGFLLRAAVALALEWTGSSRRFAPDETTYVADGWPIGMYWAGDLLVKPWRMTLDQPHGYFYLNGASYYLFGPTQIPLKLLNAFVGAFSCRYVYSLARELFGVSVARRATTLFVYFPSLVLWSALNIRDAWVVFLIVYTSAKSLQLTRGYSHLALVQLLLATYAMTHFRDYLFYVVALPPVIAVLIARRGHLVRNFVIATLAALAVVVLVQQGVVRKKTASRMSLEGLSQTRQEMATGGSAFHARQGAGLPADRRRLLPVLPLPVGDHFRAEAVLDAGNDPDLRPDAGRGAGHRALRARTIPRLLPGAAPHRPADRLLLFGGGQRRHALPASGAGDRLLPHVRGRG